MEDNLKQAIQNWKHAKYEDNLKQAIQNWKHAKYEEGLWKMERLECEQELENHIQLKKGTNTFGDLKITKSEKVEWDTDSMDPEFLKTYFIEETTYKPVAARIKYLQEYHPDKWKQLREFQTITPKKNNYSVIKEKV